MGGRAMVRSIIAKNYLFLFFSLLIYWFNSPQKAIAQQNPGWTFSRTSLSSVIALPYDIYPVIDGDTLLNGDYVGVFYDSAGTLACAGFVMWDGEENVGLTAYGDDTQITPGVKEGFSAGEAYKWKVWKRSNNQEYDAEVVFDAQTFPSQRVFNNNTFAVIAGLFEKQISKKPSWYFTATTDSHVVEIPTNVGPTFGTEFLQPGDYIAIFYDSTATEKACAGYLRYEGINSNLIVFGNTNGGVKNGFDIDEEFSWKLWRSSSEEEFDAQVSYDTINYVQDSLYVTNGVSGITRIFLSDGDVPPIDNSNLELDKIYSFDAKELSGSWRLVSLPGADSSINVDHLMVGQPGKIWTAFRFNRNDEFVQYHPTSRRDFFFKPGEGYLILSEDVFVVRDKIVPRVKIGVDSVFTIPLKEGWNLISNPFQYLVSWEKTRNYNRLRGNRSVIHQYISGDYRKPFIIEPYKAYFFYNIDNLPSLDIPHPIKYIPEPDFNFFKSSAPLLNLDISIENNQAVSLELFAGDAEDARTMNIPHPPSLNTTFRAGWVNDQQSRQVWISSTVDTQSQTSDIASVLLRVDITEAGEVQLNPQFDEDNWALMLTNLNSDSSPLFLQANEQSLYLEEGTHYFEVLVGHEDLLKKRMDELPNKIELAQNFPNPFNPSTTVNFSINKPQQIRLQIYDMNGRKVMEPVNDLKTAGNYSVQIDASSLASGVYIYRLITEKGIMRAKKMTLLK